MSRQKENLLPFLLSGFIGSQTFGLRRGNMPSVPQIKMSDKLLVCRVVTTSLKLIGHQTDALCRLVDNRL
jgi:hypothetical protein